MESKTIVLCADDFGLDSGVSEGILKLARLRRLSAVSCMVNMPGFTPNAQKLLDLKNQVQIGLHFNLTEGYLLSKPAQRCFSLNELLIKTHMHSVKLSFVAKEFLEQLERFVAMMHQLPDFIDGHQHVHQFPVVRHVILDLYQHKLKDNHTWIRSTWPSSSVSKYQLKAKILGFTGGKALQKQLVRLGIPHNTLFSGIYDFSPETNYRELFLAWLSMARENTLIMCHPGEGLNTADPIAPARINELNYFLSDDFLTDCEAHHVQLLSEFKE